MTGGTLRRMSAAAGVFLLCATSVLTAEARRLTLAEAVRLALEENRTLKIARFKIRESEQKKVAARSDYFPSITNQSSALHISQLQDVIVPQGALGAAAGTPIPSQTVSLLQGKETFYTSGTMIAQPLTQLLRIHQENRIAAAEVATTRDELKNAENEIALEVHTLYFGILIA